MQPIGSLADANAVHWPKSADELTQPLVVCTARFYSVDIQQSSSLDVSFTGKYSCHYYLYVKDTNDTIRLKRNQ